MGAKNHCVVMPDTDKEDALNAIVSAAFGSSGQRCMALPVIIMVGESKNWVPDLVEKAKRMTIGAGTEAIDIPPVNNKELLDRINSIIGTVEKEGGKLLLDGRNPKVANCPNGLFVGPSIFDNVT